MEVLSVQPSSNTQESSVCIQTNYSKHLELRSTKSSFGFDRLMIADDYLPPVLLPEDRRRSEISLFRDANLEFYQNVQWALDISEAEFKELSIRGIPASLIRRDPETQVVVTRERALNCDWSNLSLNENLWPTTIDLFLRGEDSDVILIAPKRHPKFRRYLEDIHILQKEGIAV